jgi:F0F1-type ATP synthase membrane subunit c/vacuolar-type H+-ATPase subunit K
MLAAVHWSTIGRVVWVSIVAGIAASTVFSLVILASARATEHRRQGRSAVALGFGVLSTLAFLVFAAGIALGVHVMLQK